MNIKDIITITRQVDGKITEKRTIINIYNTGLKIEDFDTVIEEFDKKYEGNQENIFGNEIDYPDFSKV